MKKQELLSILITFAVGFVAGMFLYFTVFPTMLQPDDVLSLDEQQAFTISSQAYGGCRTNCPAFRISPDGTYRFQYVPEAGAEPLIRSGTLPRSLQRDISRNVTPAAIAIQTTPVQLDDCPSATGGIDIRYDITIDGTTYRLDSCQTAVDFDSRAWLTLNEVWDYFSSLTE